MPKAYQFPIPSMGQIKDGEILSNTAFPIVTAAILHVTPWYIYMEEWAAIG